MVTKTLNEIFRDYETDGSAPSGVHKPIKADIRQWGFEIESGFDKHGADITASGTLNLDAATGNEVSVNGNTTITAVTLADGKERWVRFTGTPQITVGASLIGNGAGANIVVQAGDWAVFKGYPAGVVCFVLWRLSGRAVVIPTTLATNGITDAETLGQLSAINTQTASYVLVLGDKGATVEMNVAGANTLTVPPNSSVAFPLKSYLNFTQYGAGITTLTPGSGVTLRNRNGLRTAGQYALGTLYKRATDEWVVAGDLQV